MLNNAPGVAPRPIVRSARPLRPWGPKEKTHFTLKSPFSPDFLPEVREASIATRASPKKPSSKEPSFEHLESMNQKVRSY